jgi:hypothetical protein
VSSRRSPGYALLRRLIERTLTPRPPAPWVSCRTEPRRGGPAPPRRRRRVRPRPVPRGGLATDRVPRGEAYRPHVRGALRKQAGSADISPQSGPPPSRPAPGRPPTTRPVRARTPAQGRAEDALRGRSGREVRETPFPGRRRAAAASSHTRPPGRPVRNKGTDLSSLLASSVRRELHGCVTSGLL